MISLPKKPGWKYLIPVFLTLFFLSFLSSKTMRAPWYEQWAWSAVSPATSFFSWVKGKTTHFWHHYIYLVGTAYQNERLKRQIAILQKTLNQLLELTQENKRLTDLLGLKQNQWPPAIAARVIAFDPRSEFLVIRIDKGSSHGVQPNRPVMAIEGLVGKVGPVFNEEATVLLLIDPAVTVDVFIQRSNLRALLSGSGVLREARLRHGYFLTHLEYLKKESDIEVGDTVVTSGLDRLYPSGILAGTIESIEKDRYGLFLEAKVRPAVDFSKLREVLVLEK